MKLIDQEARARARPVLKAAPEAEVEEHVEQFSERTDADGHQTVVKSRYATHADARRLVGNAVFAWSIDQRLPLGAAGRVSRFCYTAVLSPKDGERARQDAEESVQGRAKKMIHKIHMAKTKEKAESAFHHFLAVVKHKYPKATECLH